MRGHKIRDFPLAEITWFSQAMDERRVLYGVEMDNVTTMFNTIDADAGGTVDYEELNDACERQGC
jgi:hypothetical protein